MTVSRLKNEYQHSDDSEEGSATPLLYTNPIRIGPQTKYGNNRWEVYSRKLQRNVTLYSNLEYDHWVLVESNPEIETFCEQPLKIKIRLPIGVVTTIFDIWIKWKSGYEEFREIKYEDELQKYQAHSRVARQIQAQKKWCELKNRKYSIVTEETIHANLIYLSNWKFILRHLDNVNHLRLEPYRERVILMLIGKGSSSLGEVKREFKDIDSSIIRSAIFELIYSGQLVTSLEDKPLNMNSILELANA